MKTYLAIAFTALSAAAFAADSPFKKSTATEDEKILNIKPIENTNPKKLPAMEEPKSEFDSSPDRKTGESGLPLPRFVTLKSGEVNGRSGPGETYPIQWVYQRKNLPVEVITEFKMWRRIRDIDGDQTWVHQALLKGERYGIMSQDSEIYDDENSDDVVAKFKKGVQAKIVECKKSQCELQYGKISGWTDRKNIWGVYDDEKFD